MVEASAGGGKLPTADHSFPTPAAAGLTDVQASIAAAAAAARAAAAAFATGNHVLPQQHAAAAPAALTLQLGMCSAAHPAPAVSPAAVTLAGLFNPAVAAAAANTVTAGYTAAAASNAAAVAAAASRGIAAVAASRKRLRSSDDPRSPHGSSRDSSPKAMSRSRSRSRSSASDTPRHQHSSKAHSKSRSRSRTRSRSRSRSRSSAGRYRASSSRRSSSQPDAKKQKQRSSSKTPAAAASPVAGAAAGDLEQILQVNGASAGSGASPAANGNHSGSSRQQRTSPVSAGKNRGDRHSGSRSRGRSRSHNSKRSKSASSKSRSRTRSRSSGSRSSRGRSRSSSSRSSSRSFSSRSHSRSSHSRSSSGGRRSRRSRRRSSSSGSGRRRRRRYSRSPPMLMRGPPGGMPIYRTTRAYSFDGPPGVPPGPPGPWGPPPLGPPGGFAGPGFRGGRGPGPGFRGVPMPPWVLESTLSHPIKRQLQYMYDIGLLLPLMLDVACIEQLEKLTDGEASYALDELGKALSDRIRLRNPSGFFIRICQRLRSSRREREREGLGPEGGFVPGGLGAHMLGPRDRDLPPPPSRDARDAPPPRDRTDPRDRDGPGFNPSRGELDPRAEQQQRPRDHDAGRGPAAAAAVSPVSGDEDQGQSAVAERAAGEEAKSGPAAADADGRKPQASDSSREQQRPRQQQQESRLQGPDREQQQRRDWGPDGGPNDKEWSDRGPLPFEGRQPLARGAPDRDHERGIPERDRLAAGGPVPVRPAAAVAGRVGDVGPRELRERERDYERGPPFDRPWVGPPAVYRGGSPPSFRGGSPPPYRAGSPPHRYGYGPPPPAAAGPGRGDSMRDSSRDGPPLRAARSDLPNGSSSRHPYRDDRDSRELGRDGMRPDFSRDLGREGGWEMAFRDRERERELYDRGMGGAGGRGSPVYDGSAPPRGAAARESSPPRGQRGRDSRTGRQGGHRSRSPAGRNTSAAAPTVGRSSSRSQQQVKAVAEVAGALEVRPEQQQRDAGSAAAAVGGEDLPPLPASPPPTAAAAAVPDAGPIISDLDALGGDDNLPMDDEHLYRHHHHQQQYGRSSDWDAGYQGYGRSSGAAAAGWDYQQPQQQHVDAGRGSQDSDDFEIQPWDGSPISQDGSPMSPGPVTATTAAPAAAGGRGYPGSSAVAAGSLDHGRYPRDDSSIYQQWQDHPQRQQQYYDNDSRHQPHAAAGDYYSRDGAYGWPEHQQQHGGGRAGEGGYPAYDYGRGQADRSGPGAAAVGSSNAYGGGGSHMPAPAATAYAYVTSPGAAGGGGGSTRAGGGGGAASHSELRIAVTDVIKDILKPVWKSGKLSREAFKAVAKRATDKVLSGLPPPGAPDAPLDTAEGAAAYLNEQRRGKIRALVDGYVQKYGSM